MAVIRCPNCGKPNPDFLEVCQYCESKLHAADGSPVDSRAPASADDTVITPPAPRTPAPEPAAEDDQPLGWMDRLRQIKADEAPAAAPADEPDWMWTGTLREPGQPKPDDIPIPAPSESSADLPEWLRDLDESRDQYPAVPEPPPTPSAAPAGSITNYKLPITPEPARPTEPPAITNSQPERPSAPPPPVPAEPSPFEPTASDVTIPPRSRRKMTDWLNKLQELPPPTPPAEPAAPVIPNTDADLPDWLKAMAAEAETPGSAAPAVEAATQHLSPSAAQTPEDELPDWLRALRAKSEPPRPAPGTAALQNRPTVGTGGSPAGTGNLALRRNQELPEALRPPANDETLIPRPGAKPLQAASDDMPDWLKGILSPADAAAADLGASEHPTTLTGPAADAGRKPGGSRPFGAARETPSPNTTILPPAEPPSAPARSITGQAMPPTAAPPKPPAESITNSHAERPVTPETPATDVNLPPPTRRAKRLTDWLGKTPAPAAAAAPAEELPDWLKSLSAESAAKDAQTQQTEAAVPAQELPDWLKTTPAPSDTAAPAPASAAAEPPPAAPTLPAAPIAAPSAPLPITSTPANDMPDWLKAMAPPAVDQQAAVIAPDANSLADLPDWLQAMAPSAPEAPEPAAAVSTRSDPLPAAPEPAAPAAAITAPSDRLPVTPEPEPAAATPSDDLPDWLKELSPSAQPAAAQAPEPAPEPAAPVAAAPVAALSDPLPAIAEPTPSEDLPDWLKAITAAEAAAPSEIPTASAAPATQPEPAASSTNYSLPTTPEPLAAAPSEDLPDWLKAITQAEPQATAEPPATTPLPAMAAVPAAAEPPATAPLAEADEDLPDWLKAITQASEAAATAAVAPTAAEAPAPAAFNAETTLVSGPAEPAAANYDLPTSTPPEPAAEPTEPGFTLPPWLVGVGTAPLPDVQDLPDLDEETLAWLSESKKAETTPEPAGLDLTNTKLPDEKPDWLDALAAVSTPHAASPAAPAAPAAPADIAATPVEDMPDWLRSMRGQASAEPASAAATPDWLQALRGQGASAAAAAATTDDEDDDSAEAITAATPAPAGPTPALSTAAAPDTSGLTQGALPAWLAAMRPVDIEHPVPTEADAYEETLGVLAGMRGVLRAEPVVAQPHKASAALQSVVISDSNAAQVKILAELLLPEAAAQPARRGRARLAAHAERWVIFTLLLLALVLAQFQTQLQSKFGLPALFGAPAANLPPESGAVFSIIENVPAGKAALVAFDYDAGQSGELDPGAQALIAQLAKRGVQVVAVSQNLTGPAVAQQVLSQAATGGYVNLGYIPGGPVGLLQFASSPTSSFTTDFMGNSANWGAGALASVRSLADFGVIVLVSGTPESTRAWIEQAQAQAPSVPMVAVISAGAEPMLWPYYDNPDANSLVAGHLPLKGLVVGLSGAAAYEQAVAAPGAATALWPALGGGLLAAAAIILAGNVIFGLLGGLRRRRA